MAAASSSRSAFPAANSARARGRVLRIFENSFGAPGDRKSSARRPLPPGCPPPRQPFTAGAGPAIVQVYRNTMAQLLRRCVRPDIRDPGWRHLRLARCPGDVPRVPARWPDQPGRDHEEGQPRRAPSLDRPSAALHRLRQRGGHLDLSGEASEGMSGDGGASDEDRPRRTRQAARDATVAPIRHWTDTTAGMVPSWDKNGR
jgi:hypothetical protein